MRGRHVDLYLELRAVVDLLNDAGIDYALCGGLAVGIHGYARFTKDIDLLVRKDDLERILTLVRELEFDLPVAHLPFDVGTERESWVHRVSKAEHGELLSLDLLGVTPVYEPVWQTRRVLEWRGRPIQVVSREGLAAMKRLAGRGQDRLDLEKLGFDPNAEGPTLA